MRNRGSLARGLLVDTFFWVAGASEVERLFLLLCVWQCLQVPRPGHPAVAAA